MPINRYNLFLQSARLHARSTSLERVLDSLSDAVRECSRNIDRAQASGNEDYAYSVVDDEADVVESLVGTAFVATQTQITGIVTSLMRLHKTAVQDGRNLVSSSGERKDLIQMGNRKVGTPSFGVVQVIDAAANLFKHQSEWTLPWKDLKGHQAKTAEIILAVGGREASTGPLRTILEALGMGYDSLSSLHEEVAVWAENIIFVYQQELHSLGLL